MIPNDIDENLWVILSTCCGGKHYLGYNPHTFIGRISVWCPRIGNWTRISKIEISEMSELSKYWMIGYLNGCEPDAPRDIIGDYFNEDSLEMELWRRSIKLFSHTGYWDANLNKCESCNDIMEHSRIGLKCFKCAQQGDAPETVSP